MKTETEVGEKVRSMALDPRRTKDYSTGSPSYYQGFIDALEWVLTK